MEMQSVPHFFTFSGQDLGVTLLIILGKPSGLLISVLNTMVDNQYTDCVGFATNFVIYIPFSMF